ARAVTLANVASTSLVFIGSPSRYLHSCAVDHQQADRSLVPVSHLISRVGGARQVTGAAVSLKAATFLIWNKGLGQEEPMAKKATTGKSSTTTKKSAAKPAAAKTTAKAPAKPSAAKRTTPTATPSKGAPRKQSSEKTSIAGKVLRTAKATVKQVKSLAGSVLGQDETKGTRTKK
ncbi:hypothetical protein AB4144_08495, partial [Rhizobiaceae sp. 2RAB30]